MEPLRVGVEALGDFNLFEEAHHRFAEVGTGCEAVANVLQGMRDFFKQG